MENIIPINGRIAIVDDKIEQALPLMRVLSRHNIPYVYYKGNDIKYLPQTPENDIRVLFLDLNLLGEKIEKEKDIRSVLFSCLKRIISPQNYPYVLVLWSRQENEYAKVLEDLFQTDLKDCSPITIANYVKSDFFPNFSQELDESVDDEKILDELKNILYKLPSYSYIMQWENCIHNSADETIQNVFHDFHSKDDWHKNANCILDMFARSYLEQHYRDSSIEERSKASLLFLNDVYYDTLESNITSSTIDNAVELQHEVETERMDEIKSKINNYLLLSKSQTQINQPGCIFTGIDGSVECIRCSKSLLNDSVGTGDIRSQVYGKFGDMRTQVAKNLYNQLMKERRDAILSNAVPCGVVVTPACDYAQNKAKYDRIVMGIIIDACYKQLIDTKSEAIYVSPSFAESSCERVLVLNYRYFITQELTKTKGVKTLYRIRNSVLSEIQSKLARHISRQGVMNL